MPATPFELARIAATAADSKKATDIVVLDISPKSDVCDYFVIATGATARQVDAIVDEVREKVSANLGVSPLSCEGRAGLSWVLVDYGSVVVHVFQPEARDYYRLESLWGDAPRVSLGLEGEAGADAVSADDAPAHFTVDEGDLVDNLPASSDPVE